MQIKEIISKVGEDNIRKAIESDDPNGFQKLMEEEGILLNDEQLDYIAGGILKPRGDRRPLVARPRKRRNSDNGGDETASGNERVNNDVPGIINWPDDPDITELP